MPMFKTVVDLQIVFPSPNSEKLEQVLNTARMHKIRGKKPIIPKTSISMIQAMFGPYSKTGWKKLADQ